MPLDAISPISTSHYRPISSDYSRPLSGGDESVESLLDTLSPEEKRALSAHFQEIAEDAEYRAEREKNSPNSPIYRALAAIAHTLSLFVELRIQGNQSLFDHITRHTDLTRSQVKWQYAQAGIAAVSGLAAGGLGIASGLFVANPKSATPEAKAEYFRGTALGASSTLFSKLGDAGHALSNAPITERESSKTVVSQVGFQSDQGRRDTSDEVLRRACQFILSIIEQNGRGG